ncbi:hypothetical protein ACLB2K_029817 [Fragaria x ananassa]
MPTHLLLQLSQTITQLASRIDDIESRGAQQPLFSSYGHRPCPFTPRVQMDKRPTGTKPLKVDKYKGTGDPHLYLGTFFSLCSPTGYSDAMACHAFQESLSDEALSWFLNLPLNSIDNFDQLSEHFLSRFILHASIYRSVDALFHIKQKDGEGLYELLSRWQSATARCHNLEPRVAEQAFL